ncbi:phosphotransferase [Microbacterium sp. A93]|uniref:phosphotransferase n=1 Tax=Microbacterium sp. A93 TaxID=3450716 RepID=UPI003F423423
MELAALASAAIPDLSPTGVVGSPDDPRDFSAAVVFDRQGSQWRVRSPLHEEAAMRLETELQVLSGFTAGIRAGLPFRVPSVAGAVRLDGMRTFVYHDMPGVEMELEELAELGSRTSEDIGRVIAAVHALPAHVVENADLPVYTADQFRQRRLNELDQAATTGRIPAVLLRRWENALEEMELWDFTPVVTHGDLHEDNLLVDQDRLVSVTGWTDLHIGDPAEDFAWLASSGNQSFTEDVVTAYWQHRSGGIVQDEHLLRRAVLAAEFALAQWLVRGLAARDEEMSSEAEAMLGELRADVEEHGGQEISAAPAGPRAAPAPEAMPRQDQGKKTTSGPPPAPTVAPTIAPTIAPTGTPTEGERSAEAADGGPEGSGAGDDDLADAVIIEREPEGEPETAGHVESGESGASPDPESADTDGTTEPSESETDAKQADAEQTEAEDPENPEDPTLNEDEDAPVDAGEPAVPADPADSAGPANSADSAGSGDPADADAVRETVSEDASGADPVDRPTTALNLDLELDEVRHLDIRRTTDPS